MDLDTLTKEVVELKKQVHALVVEELDQTGDAQTRYAEARRLAERATELKNRLDTLPEKQSPILVAVLYQLNADLSFLEYAANKAESQPEAPADVFGVIRQFSEEVFTLARALLEGKVTPAEAAAKVGEFDARFQEIARLPGHETPEMQHLLSEADLELTWIFNGGNGATSLRLNRLLPK